MKLLTEKELEYLDTIYKDLEGDSLKQYIYSKGYRDLDFFGTYFLTDMKTKDGKRVKTPDFHHEIRDQLDASLSVKDKVSKGVVIVPRAHGKSSSLLIYIINAMLYKKKTNIMYIASGVLGEESIGKIRALLENNERITGIFGGVVPVAGGYKKDEAKKWRQKRLELLNDTSVETLSSGQTVRGKRPDLIVVDDFDENKDTVNPTIVEKRRNRFLTSVYNTLLDGGAIIVLGTVVGHLCLVSYLQESGRPTIFHRAIENGKPLRPEMRTIASLADRKDTIGEDRFNQEYMNIPILLNSLPFFKKELAISLEPLALSQANEYKDDKYPGLSIYRSSFEDNAEETAIPCVMGIDIAEGGIKGDYSAIVMRDYEYNLLATYYGKIPPHSLCEVVDYLINERGFKVDRNKLGSEINATPGGMFIESAKKYDWYRLIYERETVDKIVNKATGKKGRHTNVKTRRLILERVKELFEDGSLDEFDERQITEMQNFAFNEKNKPEAISPYHDDLIMADAICCWLISKPRKRLVSFTV